MSKIPLVLLSIGTLLMTPSCRPDPGERRTTFAEDPSAALGRRIAGTWLGTYELDVPEFPKTAFISTYHADGTAVTTSARMFGAGDPTRNGLSSTQHVLWERIGPREIGWRILHFGHDVDGNTTYISRTHGVVDYDEAFEQSRGRFWVEVFRPETLLEPLNPNNSEAQPIFTATGTSVAKRLRLRITNEAGASDGPLRDTAPKEEPPEH